MLEGEAGRAEFEEKERRARDEEGGEGRKRDAQKTPPVERAISHHAAAVVFTITVRNYWRHHEHGPRLEKGGFSRSVTANKTYLVPQSISGLSEDTF